MASRRERTCHCGRRYYQPGKECPVCTGKWTIKDGLTYKKCTCEICGKVFDTRTNTATKYCVKHRDGKNRPKPESPKVVVPKRCDPRWCKFYAACQVALQTSADFPKCCQAEKNIAHLPPEVYEKVQEHANALYETCRANSAKRTKKADTGKVINGTFV